MSFDFTGYTFYILECPYSGGILTHHFAGDGTPFEDCDEEGQTIFIMRALQSVNVPVTYRKSCKVHSFSTREASQTVYDRMKSDSDGPTHASWKAKEEDLAVRENKTLPHPGLPDVKRFFP